MNKRRKLKKLFAGIDEMPLPKTEKMLPPEALVNKDTPVITRRKPFPMLAAASLAIVALTVVTVPFIGSVVNYRGEDPDNNSLLKNESLFGESHESQANSTVSEYSEAPIIDMPIISCGKYNPMGTDSTVSAKPGEVVLTTMRGGGVSVDGQNPFDYLKDDVLYAVTFLADYNYSQAYKDGIARLKDEWREKRNAVAEKILNYLKEHEKEEYDDVIQGFERRCETYPSEKGDYDCFCDFVVWHMYISYLPQPTWFMPMKSEMKLASEELEEKTMEFGRITRETANKSLYEYLEGIGIKFYDKTVYVCDDFTNEIKSEEVYRVAFLTKEQIQALKGVENYGILVKSVFDELAKMDNEPVYLKPWLVID